jgi:pyruvate/2-oxoglutarate dehydrogenase complex dihydrolipoamide acyltransferase (E2) component
MNDTIPPHRVVDLPAARLHVLDFLELASWDDYMFAILEVDVTRARRGIEEHLARTGERVSFSGYLGLCLARAVDEDKSVQAYMKGRKQMVLFDDVDIGMMIERRIDGTHAPVGYVIRRANRKSLLEIHREIRAVQTGPAPQSKEAPRWMRLLHRLPRPLARLFFAAVRRAMRDDPAGKWVAMAGTVSITAVGMFGEGGGWGLVAPTGHTLCLIVGGIARKPAVVDDHIEPHEFLCLTVGFNHKVVDGAPAARFARRLVELIESGYGLDALRTNSAGPTLAQAERAPA